MNETFPAVHLMLKLKRNDELRLSKGIKMNDPFFSNIDDTYKEIVAKYDDRGADCFEEIDKWEFYDKTKEHSSVVIQTGESALYANIILKKGVVTD